MFKSKYKMFNLLTILDYQNSMISLARGPSVGDAAAINLQDMERLSECLNDLIDIQKPWLLPVTN